MKLKSILSAIALPLLWLFSIFIFVALPIPTLGNYKWFLMGVICSLMGWGITYLFVKLDGLSLSQIGLRWQSDTLKKFFLGCVLGLAIALVMLGLVVIFTDLRIERNTTDINVWAMFWLILFVPLSFMEELAFRGYAFIKLNKVIGPRLTLIITSILFAYYHDATGATFLGQLIGPGIWGIIYGLAALW
ncbi:MAG: lysostaphin resistance A-like protein, partial [Bacteroidota bacterium]